MSRKRQIRRITLSKEERKELRRRIRQTKDRKIADRLRIIWYKADGYKHHIIAHLLQIGIDQVSYYVKLYLREGLDALCHRLQVKLLANCQACASAML